MKGTRLEIGDIVSHFKRDLYLAKEHGEGSCRFSTDPAYLYKILCFATHTETKEKLVIYEALYSSEELHVKLFEKFARPYDMFMSEVDRVKYPNAKQTYRFEKWE